MVRLIQEGELFRLQLEEGSFADLAKIDLATKALNVLSSHPEGLDREGLASMVGGKTERREAALSLLIGQAKVLKVMDRRMASDGKMRKMAIWKCVKSSDPQESTLTLSLNGGDRVEHVLANPTLPPIPPL